MLSREPSTPMLLQPHELDVIEEGNGKESDTGTDTPPTTPGDEVKIRGESTPTPYQEKKSRSVDRRSLQLSRRHVEDSQGIQRSETKKLRLLIPLNSSMCLSLGSHSINRRPIRKRCGQTSVSRPLVGTYDNSDVAIQVKLVLEREPYTCSIRKTDTIVQVLYM